MLISIVEFFFSLPLVYLGKKNLFIQVIPHFNIFIYIKKYCCKVCRQVGKTFFTLKNEK